SPSARPPPSTTTSKLPSSSAVVSPTMLPFSSLMVTVLPGSAVPVTVVLSTLPLSSKLLVISSTSGASGAVVSPVMVVGSDSLPALSVAVTSYSSPSARPPPSTTSAKYPSSPPLVSPTMFPFSYLMVAVLPVSALSVHVALPTLPLSSKLLVISSTSGASGAVVSPVMVVGSDSLPALSVAVTSYSSPSARPPPST